MWTGHDGLSGVLGPESANDPDRPVKWASRRAAELTVPVTRTYTLAMIGLPVHACIARPASSSSLLRMAVRADIPVYSARIRVRYAGAVS